MKVGNLYMKLRGKDWVVVMAPTFAPYHVQGFNSSSVQTILNRAGFSLQDLKVIGEVCGQQGDGTLRKTIEFGVARAINTFGRLLGQGLYMSIWVQKAKV